MVDFQQLFFKKICFFLPRVIFKLLADAIPSDASESSASLPSSSLVPKASVADSE